MSVCPYVCLSWCLLFIFSVYHFVCLSFHIIANISMIFFSILSILHIVSKWSYSYPLLYNSYSCSVKNVHIFALSKLPFSCTYQANQCSLLIGCSLDPLSDWREVWILLLIGGKMSHDINSLNETCLYIVYILPTFG